MMDQKRWREKGETKVSVTDSGRGVVVRKEIGALRSSLQESRGIQRRRRRIQEGG